MVKEEVGVGDQEDSSSMIMTANSEGSSFHHLIKKHPYSDDKGIHAYVPGMNDPHSYKMCDYTCRVWEGSSFCHVG